MSGQVPAAELCGYAGKRFLGVVDCSGCTEIVFSEACGLPNLLSIYADGRHSHGHVAVPEEYVREADAWRQSEAA
jgi:hypothetical protein